MEGSTELYVICGLKKSGATKLVNVSNGKDFNQDTQSTVLDSNSLILNKGSSTESKGMLVDCGSNENYKSLIFDKQATKAKVIILAIDVTSQDSFSEIDNYVKDIPEKEKKHLVLVGTKADLTGNRCISPDALKKKANEIGCVACYESSAKQGIYINTNDPSRGEKPLKDNFFKDIAQKVYEKDHPPILKEKEKEKENVESSAPLVTPPTKGKLTWSAVLNALSNLLASIKNFGKEDSSSEKPFRKTPFSGLGKRIHRNQLDEDLEIDKKKKSVQVKGEKNVNKREEKPVQKTSSQAMESNPFPKR